MTVLEVFPDVEGGARAWLRTRPQITALVANRVFMFIPDVTDWPLIVIHQASGSTDPNGIGIYNATLQFDCWGPPRADGRAQKDVAAQVKRALLSELAALRSGTSMGAGVTALGAQIRNAIWLPDRDTNQARYAVTALVSARAT